MRVLVCGGRYYNDYTRLSNTLRDYDIDVLIHGAASGADSLADFYGKNDNLIIQRYPADWKKYGRSAGYKRNAQMLEEGKPDLVIAFPGGKGTAMMIDIARKAGVEVVVVEA